MLFRSWGHYCCLCLRNCFPVTIRGGEVLCVCENGYGKRTPVSEFTIHNRGGMGVIAINASKRNGNFVGAAPIRPSSEVMICTDAGVVIRMDSQTISKASRNTLCLDSFF